MIELRVAVRTHPGSAQHTCTGAQCRLGFIAGGRIFKGVSQLPILIELKEYVPEVVVVWGAPNHYR